VEKSKLFEKYKKEEDRLLISKLLDKIAFVDKTNKIQYTDFLTPVELQILKDVLNIQGIKQYIVFGGIENAQRNMIIIYPNKLESLFETGNFDYNSLCSCIRIINNQEKYDHKVYLGGLIKLGIKREKIGDIITFENGADIVVDNEIAKFLISNITELTRFQKSKVNIIGLNEITNKEQEYKDLKIIVSSLRLDNIVSELAKTSRAKSLDILKQERVFINYKNETKPTKLVQTGDIITIRGKGKFLIDNVECQTRSGRVVVLVRMYI
jgi:RNA-binding protein YlmH